MTNPAVNEAINALNRITPYDVTDITEDYNTVYDALRDIETLHDEIDQLRSALTYTLKQAEKLAVALTTILDQCQDGDGFTDAASYDADLALKYYRTPMGE